MDSLRNGVELFNAASFWHAHEAWEADWLVAEAEEKVFLQGLIQLAAAYHHVQKGTTRGAVRLFDAAVEKLQTVPEGFAGVDRSFAVTAAIEHRERIARGGVVKQEEYPSLRYN